jgi:hypothetical protein
MLPGILTDVNVVKTTPDNNSLPNTFYASLNKQIEFFAPQDKITNKRIFKERGHSRLHGRDGISKFF